MANERLTVEDIEKMSENEWQDYRKASWDKKREQHAGAAPTWYLSNKDEFVKFMTEQNARLAKRNIKPSINPSEIANYSDSQWSEYREKQWAKKGAAYKGDIPPWYLKSKEDFVKYLKEHQK